MMTNREALSQSMGVITRVPYNFLATIDFDGEPDVRTMMNLRNKEIYPSLENKFSFGSFKTYIPVNTNSRQSGAVAANPKALLYGYGIFESVLILGELEIVQEEAVKNEFWRNGWEQYFPGGKDGGEYTLLRFKTAQIQILRRKTKYVRKQRGGRMIFAGGG